MLRKLLAIIILISSLNLFSQDLPRLSVNLAFGTAFYPNNQNINAMGNIQNIYAGYKNLGSIELGMGYRFGKKFYLSESIWFTQKTPSDHANLAIAGLNTALRYNLIPFEKSRITPYIQLGLNLNSIDLTSVSSTRKVLSGTDTLMLTDSSHNVRMTSLEFAPAIGVDFKASNRIILFAEAKYHINPFSNPNSVKAIFTDNTGKLTYTTVSIGLRINLGKIKKADKTNDSTSKTYSTPNVKLTLVDSELPVLLDADIQLEDSLKFPQFKKSIAKERTGRYAFKLESGKNYKFIIKRKYYEDLRFDIDLTKGSAVPEFEKLVNLKPRKKQYLLEAFNAENLEFMIVNLEITNKDMDENLKPTLNRDNKYAINLREGNRYNVEVKSSQGKFFYTEDIIVGNDSLKPQPEVQTIKLPVQSIKVGSSLLLKDILYKYNSDELVESSYSELNRVVELMKLNPTLNIEIAAHTDETGSAEYNLSLSDRRAKFVTNYIIKSGIEASRLAPKGYGKSKPISPNDTEANRQKNRRLELKVLKYQP